MSDNFLSRWSRRKIEVRTQEKEGLAPFQATDAPVDQQPLAQQREANLPAASQANDTPKNSVTPDLPVPTEVDLKAVEQGGDIKAFLTDKVAPELKNRAFKALFSRPEFNVMDGLDIYIDDYNKFTPLTQEDIGKMSMSKQLLSRPDLDVIQPEVATDLPLPVDAELQEISAVEGADTDGESPPQNVDHAASSPENHEGVRVIPDGAQDIDSKTLDVNRSFEK